MISTADSCRIHATPNIACMSHSRPYFTRYYPQTCRSLLQHHITFFFHLLPLFFSFISACLLRARIWVSAQPHIWVRPFHLHPLTFIKVRILIMGKCYCCCYFHTSHKNISSTSSSPEQHTPGSTSRSVNGYVHLSRRTSKKILFNWKALYLHHQLMWDCFK